MNPESFPKLAQQREARAETAAENVEFTPDELGRVIADREQTARAKIMEAKGRLPTGVWESLQAAAVLFSLSTEAIAKPVEITPLSPSAESAEVESTAREKFRLGLRQLESAGYPVHFSDTVVIGDLVSPDRREIVTEIIAASGDKLGSRDDYGSVADWVAAEVADRLMLPPELQKREEPVRLSPFDFQTLNDDLVVVDWVTGETVYRASFSDISSAASPEERQRRMQTLATNLAQTIGREAKKAQKTWDKEKREPIPLPEPALSLRSGEVNSEIVAVAEQTKMRLFVTPQGQEMDPLRDTDGITIDRQFIESSKAQALEINGSADLVTFYREFSATNNAAEFERIRNARWYEEVIDGAGNVGYVQRGIWEGVASEEFALRPRIIFSQDFGPEGEMQPVTIDLSEQGIGRLDNYLYQPVERPLMSLPDQRLLYSSMDHERVIRDYGDVAPALSEGVSNAEKLFGQEPTTTVKNIMVVDAKNPNAHFNPSNNDTVVFRDAVLDAMGEAAAGDRWDPVITAQHEAIHAMDWQYQLSSDPELIALQQKLMGITFDAISEKSWFAGKTAGGHADDNAMEAIASGINTLTHPQLEEKIRSLPEPVREEYGLWLTTLRSRLIERTRPPYRNPLPEDAPIFQRIDLALATIE